MDSVTEFLYRYFGCSLEVAVRCTLEAYEAQVFLYELKECCRLVSLLAAGEIDETEYAESQLVSTTQTTARSRAVVRRAGLVWATLEAHETGSEPDYASYVPRVDAILYRRTEQNQRLVSQLTALADELGDWAMNPDRREFRPERMNQLFDANPELRAEVYFILLLFGCPGSVQLEEYLARFA